jgi:hypothetical protein
VSIEEKLARAVAELDEVRAAGERVRAELDAASATALSRDRAVEATVGAQNQLVALSFPGERHRSMSGEALAASVTEAIERARQEMAERVTGLLRPLTERATAFSALSGSVEPPEVPAGEGVEWEALFGRLTRPPAPPLHQPGEQTRKRLRDEIVEEPEAPAVPAEPEPAAEPRSARLLDEIVEDEAEPARPSAGTAPTGRAAAEETRRA